MPPSQITTPGTLYIVATPIGHLDDLTLRARNVLNQVDRVCCEDTRHSARLMEHLSISPVLTSLHEHNEREKSALVIQWLQQGESIALISDAGTPLISDPGFVLVNEAIAAGAQVVPIPGVSAVITALSVGGLPTDHFSFEGFLPARSSARKAVLAAVDYGAHTRIFYESSHRIAASLKDMQEIFGAERRMVLARELTKTFETVLRGTIEEISVMVDADPNQRKGEFVLLVAGQNKLEAQEVSAEARRLAQTLLSELPPKKLAAALADAFGGGKKLYYDYLLGLRHSPDEN